MPHGNSCSQKPLAKKIADSSSDEMGVVSLEGSVPLALTELGPAEEESSAGPPLPNMSPLFLRKGQRRTVDETNETANRRS